MDMTPRGEALAGVGIRPTDFTDHNTTSALHKSLHMLSGEPRVQTNVNLLPTGAGGTTRWVPLVAACVSLAGRLGNHGSESEQSAYRKGK